MKRKLYLLNAVMALAVSGIMAGCDDPIKPEEPKEEPKFVIEESSISDVSHEGATLMVGYYVQNPAEGASIVFDTDGIDWAGDVSASTDGMITIEILPNESEEPRTGEIVASYVYVFNDEEKSQQQSILISQQGAPYVVPFAIAIDEKGITHESVMATVEPSDIGMTYIVMSVEKEVFDIQIGSEDVLFTQILNQYVSVAAGEGVSLEEFFENHDILKTGKSDVMITGLIPETGYYLFAVGISPSGMQLSDFVFVEFVTLEEPVIETGFEFEVNLEGTSGSIKVTPSDEELYFYSDVIACNVFDETIMYWDDYARELIGQSLDTYMNAGYTIEEAIDRICYKGTSYVEFWFLTPLSDYYVYAFAVSLDGEVISDVFTDVFTTGEES